MSSFVKALLAASAITSLFSLTRAQNEASIVVEYFSDDHCTTNLAPNPGGLLTEFGIGTAVGVPFVLNAQFGAFTSAKVDSTTNVASLAFCEHGCACFQAGCDTLIITADLIGTNGCLSDRTLVGQDGIPPFLGTQWDKMSVTLI